MNEREGVNINIQYFVSMLCGVQLNTDNMYLIFLEGSLKFCDEMVHKKFNEVSNIINNATQIWYLYIQFLHLSL